MSENGSTTSKDELINNIKEWIKLDNEIVKFKADIKERSVKKKKLTDNLVTVMKGNSIDCFDINGGSLVYKQTKTKKPINKKTLLAALEHYYKNNKTMAEEVVQHVMDNREEQVKETIKRKMQ